MYDIAALLDPDSPTTVAELVRLGMTESEVIGELKRLVNAGEAEERGGTWFRKYPEWVIKAKPVLKVKAKKPVGQLALFGEECE